MVCGCKRKHQNLRQFLIVSIAGKMQYLASRGLYRFHLAAHSGQGKVGVQKSSMSNHRHPNVVYGMRAPHSITLIGNQTKKSVTINLKFLEIRPF